MFRTDCPDENWAYIGQSTRLDPETMRTYFGSGFNFQQATAERGTAGLQKTILATARTPLELHYLEMLHIARARAKGATLLNGDLGGPRPFPVLQRHLRQQLPESITARIDPKRFYKLLKRNRSLVEQAILDASDVPTDDFYAGMERDLMALEDLSHACPKCASPVGAVCRTNVGSPGKPHNPSRNHRARPRAGS
ncbi:hypothetical protein [Rathayibacter sp. VKM Ac-2927]|uniref:zinc finger domain-containing protein n=1 Tax=Rathayibacter sp. VKM Ac-2927 TaxID=2929478 RepID=UPI001FB2F816|nr:hypothetical protein [Rathayibacter sp. VKM Ac-2927]MCJ1688155.1 hypothetical protein [Rathayibacter sp. VKM Ac-2927]